MNQLKDVTKESEKIGNDARVALDNTIDVVRDLRLEMRSLCGASDRFRNEGENLRLSLMNKEQELADAFSQTAAAVELEALRDAKSDANHARRVSDAAKVTSLQETIPLLQNGTFPMRTI